MFQYVIFGGLNTKPRIKQTKHFHQSSLYDIYFESGTSLTRNRELIIAVKRFKFLVHAKLLFF